LSHVITIIAEKLQALACCTHLFKWKLLMQTSYWYRERLRTKTGVYGFYIQLKGVFNGIMTSVRTQGVQGRLPYYNYRIASMVNFDPLSF